MNYEIERRSVALAIILSIITCGIYFYYWLHRIMDTLYRANGRPSTAGMDIVLTIITCGIYGIYLMYKAGKLEAELYAKLGLGIKDDSLVYLLITIFGFSVIAYAILQNNINQLPDINMPTMFDDYSNGPRL